MRWQAEKTRILLPWQFGTKMILDFVFKFVGFCREEPSGENRSIGHARWQPCKSEMQRGQWHTDYMRECGVKVVYDFGWTLPF